MDLEVWVNNITNQVGRTTPPKDDKGSYDKNFLTRIKP